MKQLLALFRKHVREEANGAFFLVVAAFLAVAFGLNYSFRFETKIVRALKSPLAEIAFYVVYYSVPYFITLGAYVLTTGRTELLRQRGLWLACAVCFPVLAMHKVLHDVPWYLMKHWHLGGAIAPSYRHYVARYAGNVLPGLLMLAPIGAYWYVKDRRDSPFYGFRSSGVRLRTYGALVAMLLPLVFVASFGRDFLAMYPRYALYLPRAAHGVQRALLIGGFELCYGFDFVAVEVLYRGFMVMAFARFLGSASIVPMVVVYAFIHFPKPLGEALGSVVGGYVLGVLAYRTRSIYGGVMLHLGLAYSMELAAAVQRVAHGRH